MLLSLPASALAAGPSGDLDPDRTVPAAPALSYTDSVDIEYVDGAVLHYVDFSSVESLSEIGYYVGKNATTDNATLTIDQENGLRVQTTDQKVYITPFGAKVPRQIEDYTVQMKVKFNNPNGKYLVFNPAVNGDGTGAAKGDLAFRPQGQLDANWDQQKLWFHDKGQLMNGTTEEDANAVMEAVKAGEWATISFSVRNLGVVGVKVTAGGKTIYLQGNTARGVLGSNWGFMAGNGNDDMYVKSVAMIAGYDLTAELQWPADYAEGANVLDVPASALKSGTPGGDPTDPTDPAGPTEEGVLRVASYNIRLGGMWYGYDMEALAEEIRNSGADIIGLQEVDNNTDRNRYQETMKLLGEELGYYYYFNQVSELEGGGYGDGILSRYPITDVKEIPLQMVSQYATYGELTVAAIDVDGTEVLFGNTHFFEIDAEVSKVFQQIYDVMKDHDPFVVVGDFNNQYFEAFNSTFVDCTVANQGTYTTNENTCPDNIVLSPSIEMVDFVVTNTNASDHYLLTADIRLASGTGEEPAQHSVTLPDIFEGADDVEDGADYTFKARDTEHYVYSEVKANLPVIDNGDGTYTVKNVTEDLVISGKRTPKNDDGASGNLPGGTDSGNDSGNGGTGASDGKTDEDTQTPKTGETGGWQTSAVCALAALTLLTALTLSWKKLASNGVGGWKLRK